MGMDDRGRVEAGRGQSSTVRMNSSCGAAHSKRVGQSTQQAGRPECALLPDPTQAQTQSLCPSCTPSPGNPCRTRTNQADQGGPLTVVSFYTALRAEKAAGKRPYVPGVRIACAEIDIDRL